jgi:hypothetical protein
MVAECQQRAEPGSGEERIDISVAKVNFRSQRDANEVLDSLGLVRLLRDRLDQAPYFDSLNETINRFTELDPATGTGPLVDLAEEMARRFDLADLQLLSDSLDVSFEDLPGPPRKTHRAFGLANELFRSNRLPDLIAKLEEKRDSVDWRQGLETHLAPPDSAPEAGPAGDGGLQVDRGALLPADSGHDLAMRQITDAFFECLKQLASDGRLVVLLFDSLEEAPRGVRSWLRTQVFDRLGADELGDVVVILAGRSLPDVSGLGVEHLVAKRKLDPFDIERVRLFFEAHGIEVDPDMIESAALLSGGVPGDLTRMVDRLRAEEDRKDPFFD